MFKINKIKSTKLQTKINSKINSKINYSTNVFCQGKLVPFVPAFNVDLKSDVFDKAAKSDAMKEWLDTLDKQKGKLDLHRIELQSIDFFKERVGFLKIKAHITDKDGDQRPGIIFMRGPSVSCLVILECNGIEYVAIITQATAAIGLVDLPQLPAGMLDGGKFSGVVAREMEEELGLQIKQEEMIDLIDLTYQGKFKGMYPSSGACDEYIRLFCYRKKVNEQELKDMQGKTTGIDNEKIITSIVPLDDLWRITSDAKALSALTLYNYLKNKKMLSTL